MVDTKNTVKLQNGKNMPIFGLGTSQLPMIHMDPKLVKRSIEMSLKNLQLQYVDLYLVHLPIPLAYDGNDENVFPTEASGALKVADKTDLIGTWKAVEELVDLGLTKSIGVSNFSISQLERICEIAKYKPVVNQVECNIYLQQKEMFDACKTLGITITVYAPLGSPGRNDLMKEQGESEALEDPVIQRISHKYGKTPAQILLRFLIQKGITVIPKSVNPERIRSNFQVFDFSLSDEDMDEIMELNKNKRTFDLITAFFGPIDHPERPW